MEQKGKLRGSGNVDLLWFPIKLLGGFVTLVLSVHLEKKQNNSPLNNTETFMKKQKSIH